MMLRVIICVREEFKHRYNTMSNLLAIIGKSCEDVENYMDLEEGLLCELLNNIEIDNPEIEALIIQDWFNTRIDSTEFVNRYKDIFNMV